MPKTNVIISFDKGLDTYNEPEAMDPQNGSTIENSIQQGTGDLGAPSWMLTTPTGWQPDGVMYNLGVLPAATANGALALHGSPTLTSPPRIYDESGTISGGIVYPWQQNLSTLGVIREFANNGFVYPAISRPTTIIDPVNKIGITVWAARNASAAATQLVFFKFSLETGFTTNIQSVNIGNESFPFFDVGITYSSTSNAANFVITSRSSVATSLAVIATPVDASLTFSSTTAALGGASITFVASATFNNVLYVYSNAGFRSVSYVSAGSVSIASVVGPNFGIAGLASIYSSAPRTSAGRLSILGHNGSQFQIGYSSAPGTWTVITTSLPWTGGNSYEHVHCSFDTPQTTTLAGFSLGRLGFGTNITPITGWTYNWTSINISVVDSVGTVLIDRQIKSGVNPKFLCNPIVPAHTPVKGLKFNSEGYFPVYAVSTSSDPWNVAKSGGYSQALPAQIYLFTHEAFAGNISALPEIQIIAKITNAPVFVGNFNQFKFSFPAITSAGEYELYFGYAEAITFIETSVGLLTFGQQIPDQISAKCARFIMPKLSELAAPVVLGPNLFFPTTIETQYDGQSANEIAFLGNPPPLAAITATTGGSMTPGIYYYRYNYVYIDNNGIVHQSAFSAPFGVTVSNGTNTNIVTLASFAPLATLRVPSNLFTNSLINVQIFRTEANAGVVETFQELPYRLCGRFVVQNSPSDPLHFTFTDTLNDLTLATRTRMALSNGKSSKVPPPPFMAQAVFQQRLWGISYDNGYNLFVSYPFVDTLPADGVGFGTDTKIDVPVDVGEIKGLAALDDALIVFGTDADFLISGKAQSEGQAVIGDTIRIVGPLPSPGGMVVANSSVRIPEGLLYQSVQGFILLNRGAGYDFKGKPVRGLTATNLYGRGILVAGENYVYFPNTTKAFGAEAIAYNYLEDRWFTLKAVFGPAGLTAGVVRRVQGSPVPEIVSIAPSGYYTLNRNTSEQKTLETGWLQPGGLNGYGEISDMVLLGKWQGPHILQVEEAWDYGPYGTPKQQLLLTNPGDYQFRFSPVQTQVRAMRYRITVIPVNQAGIPAINGKTATIFGIMLELGADDALSRLANTRNR